MKLAHTTTINEFVTESEKILVNKPQLPVTPLEYAARISNPNGEWLEFGTGSGESTTIMSKERMGTNRVYTFDSFLGLPENWGSLTHSLTHSLIHSLTHSLRSFGLRKRFIQATKARFTTKCCLYRRDVRGHTSEILAFSSKYRNQLNSH